MEPLSVRVCSRRILERTEVIARFLILVKGLLLGQLAQWIGLAVSNAGNQNLASIRTSNPAEKKLLWEPSGFLMLGRLVRSTFPCFVIPGTSFTLKRPGNIGVLRITACRSRARIFGPALRMQLHHVRIAKIIKDDLLILSNLQSCKQGFW